MLWIVQAREYQTADLNPLHTAFSQASIPIEALQDMSQAPTAVAARNARH